MRKRSALKERAGTSHTIQEVERRSRHAWLEALTAQRGIIEQVDVARLLARADPRRQALCCSHGGGAVSARGPGPVRDGWSGPPLRLPGHPNLQLRQTHGRNFCIEAASERQYECKRCLDQACVFGQWTVSRQRAVSSSPAPVHCSDGRTEGGLVNTTPQEHASNGGPDSRPT